MHIKHDKDDRVGIGMRWQTYYRSFQLRLENKEVRLYLCFTFYDNCLLSASSQAVCLLFSPTLIVG